MARTKHTLAPSASKGLKMYLTTCGRSGIPHIREKAEALMALEPKKALRAYIAEFGGEASWGDSNGRVQAEANAPVSLESFIASLDGDEEVVEEAKPKRTTRTSRKRNGLAVGNSFTYVPTGSEWEILSLDETHLVASNGKRESRFAQSLVGKGIIAL